MFNFPSGSPDVCCASRAAVGCRFLLVQCGPKKSLIVMALGLTSGVGPFAADIWKGSRDNSS